MEGVSDFCFVLSTAAARQEFNPLRNLIVPGPAAVPARKEKSIVSLPLSGVCSCAGDMYQHFEITTPGIRLLQEATDKALDAATGTSATGSNSSSRHNNPKQQHSRSSVGSADAESGGAGPEGGLTDWAEVLQQLEARSWTGWLGNAAGRLRLSLIAKNLGQREVRSGCLSLAH